MKIIPYIVGSRFGQYIVKRKVAVAKISKLIMLVFGCILLALALPQLLGLVTDPSLLRKAPLTVFIYIVTIFAIIIAAVSLISILPGSMKVKFSKKKIRENPQTVFGFWTALAVGIGSTLGSPLFVLIPDNILQYAFVTIVSLIAATLVSIGLAIIYSKLYMILESRKISIVGGPGFISSTVGTRNIRYFLSRFSGALANTALAAYSAVLFLRFDFELLPQILDDGGIYGIENLAIIIIVFLSLAIWLLINLFLSRRFLKWIGRVQIILVFIMILSLIGQIIVFFGHANPSFVLPGLRLNTAEQIFLDTGYLYIIFFGFQEITTINREVLPETNLIEFHNRKWIRIRKDVYIPVAMVASVIVSALFNVLFALSILYLSPAASIESQKIPAIYLADIYGGTLWEVILSITFLIASITTFVPAFIAASRHIGSMSEDGFLPHEFARMAHIIVLALIFILYFQSASFLISITDFMILVSLGVNAISLYWLLKSGRMKSPIWKTVSIIIGTLCIVLGSSVYFIDRSVVVLGIVAIFITYLIYDAVELGPTGAQLFIMVGSAVLALFTFSFPEGYVGYLRYPYSFTYSVLNDYTVPMVLGIIAILLLVNILIDTFLIKRYDLKPSLL